MKSCIATIFLVLIRLASWFLFWALCETAKGSDVRGVLGLLINDCNCNRNEEVQNPRDNVKASRTYFYTKNLMVLHSKEYLQIPPERRISGWAVVKAIRSCYLGCGSRRL